MSVPSLPETYCWYTVWPGHTAYKQFLKTNDSVPDLSESQQGAISSLKSLSLPKQFERGGKPGMSCRNIEVRLGVFDADGLEIQEAVLAAAGQQCDGSGLFLPDFVMEIVPREIALGPTLTTGSYGIF